MNKQNYLMIARILHRAADQYLYYPDSGYHQGSSYSCNAYLVACRDSGSKYAEHHHMVEEFLYGELGFNNTAPFPSKVLNEENQQCFRYDWLKFAAMYAEEKAAEFDKPSLADVLRLAADKYLVANQEDEDSDKVMSPYTCDTVGYACGELTGKEYDCIYTPEIMKFLHDLGLPYDFDPFKEYGDEFDMEIHEEKQGCRFLWLNFAAEYAESEGL